jgi:hypothetical protein
VKTTLDISDELLQRAKRHARKSGKTLRAVIEEGLRLALASNSQKASRFRLPDRSQGTRRGPNPLEQRSWQDLRDEIYGGR